MTEHKANDVELVANYLADCVEQEPNEYFTAMSAQILELLDIDSRIGTARRDAQIEMLMRMRERASGAWIIEINLGEDSGMDVDIAQEMQWLIEAEIDAIDDAAAAQNKAVPA